MADAASTTLRLIGFLASGCVSLFLVRHYSWTIGLTALCVPITALWLTADGSAVDEEEVDPRTGSTITNPEQQAAASEQLPEIECPEWIEPRSAIKLGPVSTPLALDNRFRECNPLSFKIRTKTYLIRKIKKPNDAGPAIFAPIGGQCYMKGDGSTRLSHTALNVPSVKEHIKANKDGFFLIVAWMIPGPPFRTAIFAFQRRVPVGNDPVFDKLFDEFLNGTDKQRKSRFKYLPRIDVAPKMLLRGVRMIGGEKPTMLCNKLTPTFFHGDNYIEVTIDIASSKPANMVTGLILPKLASVVVSHAFLLEGHTEEELPERIMGCVKTSGLQIEENTISV